MKFGKKNVFLILCMVIFLMGTAINGNCGKTIKVGAAGPMKMLVGDQIWKGAVLAAEEINKAGGIKVGNEMRLVEIVKVDDNNLKSVSDAVSAVERAITIEKVDFFTGGGRSESMLACQEVLAKHKIPYLSVSSAAMQLNARIAKNYDKYKYWFRVGVFSAKYIGATIFAGVDVIAKTIREELGIKTPRVAIIAEKVLWPNGVIKAAKAKLPKMGMELVGIWRPSPTSTDTTAELTAIKNAGAHIVWTMGGGPVDTVWSKQYGELQIPAAMTGLGTDSSFPEFWKTTNGGCNYLSITTYAADLPGRSPFVKRFKKRWNTGVSFHALSYDAIYQWKTAVEKIGTMETEAVIKALEKTDYQSFRGRVKLTPPDSPFPHDIMWGPEYCTGFLAQWQNGKLETVWPDGNSVLGDDRWKGTDYSTAKYKLPPRMIKYWKGKK